MISVLVIILAKILLLSIPYIRGYYSWRSDNISQMGNIISIFSTGHIPVNLFYPFLHVYVTELISLTGCNLLNGINHSTTIISIYYIFCIYLFASSTLHSKREYILSAAIAGVVAFNGYHRYLMPNGWSILYLPMFFYLYFKKVNPEKKLALNYSILLVIILILYPFFHPLSSFIIMFLILIQEITRRINKLLGKAKNKNTPVLKIMKLDLLNIIFIEFITFFIWIFSFRIFNLSLKRIFNAITSGSSLDVVREMGNTVNKINVHGMELIQLILKIMGDELIFLFISLCSFMILVKKKDLLKRNGNLMTIYIMMLSIGLLYSLYLFNVIPGLENLGSSRLISYLILFTPICVSFTLNYFLGNRHKILSIFCVILILISSFISIFSLYDSPYMFRPSDMVTEMDILGTEWLTSSTIGPVESVHIMTPLFRFADVIIGKTKSRDKYNKYESQVPDHFNYTNESRLGASFSNNNYIQITKFDQLAYTTVWESIGRFNDSDFIQMEQDDSVDKLYSNGESHIWFIRCVSCDHRKS